ncbi:MAG: 3-phosphoshikimate 1-carboxyvinyltransferase [Elusimicrobiota bacterium]
MKKTLLPAARWGGETPVPGDKSISLRALLFGAISDGTTRVRGLSLSDSALSMVSCLRMLGARIRLDGDCAEIEGRGLGGLTESREPLDAGGSATTLRLLMGALAGHRFTSILTGDAWLRRRPMERVAVPLRRMGAEVHLTPSGGAPVRVRGGMLKGVECMLPVASAQLKSAVLLAGLHAEGRTTVAEPMASRDHTERLLRHFGCPVYVVDDRITVQGGAPLRGAELAVPGDVSSAAFWVAAALLVPGASVALQGVLLNETRLGFIRVLRRMGADIELEREGEEPEPVGRLRAGHSMLKGVEVSPEEVPSMIDELPLLAVLAAAAAGETVVRGAAELRFKESDRIAGTAELLSAMGCRMETSEDGFRVFGPQRLRGGVVDPRGDHRIAMAASIAALAAERETVVQDAQIVSASYPDFFETLERLRA